MEKNNNSQFIKKSYSVPNRNDFDDIKIEGFVTNKDRMKTITIIVAGWFYETTKKEMSRLKRNIKRIINQYSDNEIFKKQIIDIDTIPYNFDDTNNGYISFEYTLFYNRPVNFNRQEQILTVTDLATKIYEEVFQPDNTLIRYKEKQKE